MKLSECTDQRGSDNLCSPSSCPPLLPLQHVLGAETGGLALRVQVHATEQRVEDTVRNLTELEDSLKRSWAAPAEVNASAGPASTAAQQSSASSSSSTAVALQQQPAAALERLLEPEQQQQAPAQQQEQQRQQQQQRGKRGDGLQSTLTLPERLKNFWYPVDFSSRLGADKMLTLELFEEVGPCRIGDMSFFRKYSLRRARAPCGAALLARGGLVGVRQTGLSALEARSAAQGSTKGPRAIAAASADAASMPATSAQRRASQPLVPSQGPWLGRPKRAWQCLRMHSFLGTFCGRRVYCTQASI